MDHSFVYKKNKISLTLLHLRVQKKIIQQNKEKLLCNEKKRNTQCYETKAVITIHAKTMRSSPYSEKGMHCAQILGLSPLVLCQSVSFIHSHNLMKHLTNEKHITCSYNRQVRAKFLKLLG